MNKMIVEKTLDKDKNEPNATENITLLSTNFHSRKEEHLKSVYKHPHNDLPHQIKIKIREILEYTGWDE